MQNVVWREYKGALQAFLKDGDKTEPLAWAPMPGSQVHFLACPTFEVLYEGTRGPGKTEALLISFVQHCGQDWGSYWTGILFRRHKHELRDVIKKSLSFIPSIFPKAKFNHSEKFWTWPTGEKLYLQHFDSIKDYDLYHGHEYPWIGWEELTQWENDDGYCKMMSCCRHSGPPEIPTMVRSTTNPSGRGHNWVKHRWRLPLAPEATVGPLIDDSRDYEGELEKPRRAIHGHLDENIVLLHSTPDYKQTLRTAATSEAELKCWLHGSWDIVAGGMFDDVWEATIHVLKPFTVPHSWRIDRSFDWGSSKPFSVGWWAESDGSDVLTKNGWRSTVRGDLFRIAEWYGWSGKPNKGTKMLAADVAKGIIEREIEWKLYGRVKAGPADSSIYEMENGMCIGNDMAKKVRVNGQIYPGVQWTRADKRPGSRVSGWEQVRRMLQHAKRKDGLPREEPGLFTFNTCAQFRRTFPVLPRDEIKTDDVDTDAEDHIGDEVRYRVRSVGSRPRQGTHTGMY